jgi:hypothetical protein
MHYAAIALFHVASCPHTIHSLIRHGAHVLLLRIAAAPGIACRLQAVFCGRMLTDADVC